MTKKKNKSSGSILGWVSILIALGALTISGLSYYDSIFKAHHEVQIISPSRLEYTIPREIDDYSDIKPIRFFLINRGNQSELILEANLMLEVYDDSSPRMTGSGGVINDPIESFVLNEGEVKKMEFRPYKELFELRDKYYLYAEIFYVNRYGTNSTRVFPIGEYSGVNEVMTFSIVPSKLNLIKY